MGRTSGTRGHAVQFSSTRWSIVTIVSAIGLTVAVDPARADAPPAGGVSSQEPWVRQVTLEGQVGAAAPLGVYGLAVDADVLPWLSLSAGVGLDLYDSDPVCGCSWSDRQLVAMPRFRLPVLGRGSFLSLGVGLSRNARPNVAQIHDPLFRQDDELAFEHRFENGVRVRLFTGIGFYLNGPHPPEGSASVYFGAALGYAVWPNPSLEHSWSRAPWYGWQALLLDAGAVALLAGTAGNGHTQPTQDQGARAAATLYVLSGPIVHFSHHNYVRSGVSFALRALLPLALSSFASGLRSTSEPASSPNPASFALAGAVIGVLIDDLALSWDRAP